MGGIDHRGYIRAAFKHECLVLRFFHFKLSSTSTDPMSYDEPGMTLPCWLSPVVLQFLLNNPTPPLILSTHALRVTLAIIITHPL